ncbi:hypothetical protein BN946_scf184815.g31 [Trametes cinnabarina]|uniref:Alcohol dehydrogenase-like N-terminal domain-containing protein n=1 Tax=Pycnoporus cinnabarinus TaxID=5643 RepID=A0A060S7Z2_PYCCI|nr:hypothetical protein BN946_scf184815.g31 [Trametes cinnabarina]
MAAQFPTSPPSGTMVAYCFVPGITEPQRTMMPIPTPATNEVLIKVLAAGVCHTDVHVLEASVTQLLIPGSFIMGHEGAGIVVGHGEDVAADPAHAQRLAVGTRGFANVCFETPAIGLGVDGFWAEYVKVRASTVVPVPGNNPNDPRLTPAQVKPGQTVVIVGCGGLGINAIQIAKHVLHTGTVIAVDLRADSLALAREVGADHAVMPDELTGLPSTPPPASFA